eukprot:8994493-Pyramimonas_sp.AAC.1
MSAAIFLPGAPPAEDDGQAAAVATPAPPASPTVLGCPFAQGWQLMVVTGRGAETASPLLAAGAAGPTTAAAQPSRSRSPRQGGGAAYDERLRHALALQPTLAEWQALVVVALCRRR